ncbi:MAG TPA: PIN domain-containing protein [Pseudonocardiaceae bacterium]|nr:PIN domain-containing protein [Pseudonocardiaceae bacterium]
MLLRARGTTLARIIDAVGAGSFELVISEVILIELRRTLANPYCAARIGEATADRYVQSVVRLSSIVELTARVQGIATHPEDDAILATAVSGRTDYLVTGDQPLRGLGSIEDIPIISPADSVTLLDREH